MNKKLHFAAINPYIEVNRYLPVEKENRGKEFVSWGEDNAYPAYLYDLYLNVTSLHSIINGVVTYVIGSDNSNLELIKDIALSYAIYGGFAIAVYRNKLGGIANLEVLDLRNVRTDKKNTQFWYSEDFCNGYVSKNKCLRYPKFDSDSNDAISIYFYKSNKYQVYPLPYYVGAITACEIEKCIDEFHLNSINNGFQSSCLFNFNNGQPEETEQEDIVNAIEEKFTGKDNAGRVIVSFNDDKDHQVEVVPLNPTDFSDRYSVLAERARSAIFCSWRTTPNIMGIPTETTGFNSQEYSSAFKLFNKTVIEPIQNEIIKAIKDITGEEITINPFLIKFNEE